MASTANTRTGAGDQAPPTSKATKVKRSLKDPERLEMVKTHRGLQGTMGGLTAGFRFSGNGASEKEKDPQFDGKVPKYFRPIKLRQMDPEQEWVFMKRVLFLTFTEDPMLGFTPIHQIAEDENGDATRVFIHEVPHTKKMCDLLCYGRQIAIINPYMRIALDGRHGIRVDDPDTIILVGKKTDMCRYCGKQNSSHKCTKCKRPYCSRECQVADWKEFEHKRICKKP